MTDDVSPMSSFKNVILEVDGEEGTESSYESSVKQIDQDQRGSRQLDSDMLIGSYKGGFLREEDDSPVNSNRFLSSMHAMSSEEEADERVKDVLEQNVDIEAKNVEIQTCLREDNQSLNGQNVVQVVQNGDNISGQIQIESMIQMREVVFEEVDDDQRGQYFQQRMANYQRNEMERVEETEENQDSKILQNNNKIIEKFKNGIIEREGYIETELAQSTEIPLVHPHQIIQNNEVLDSQENYVESLLQADDKVNQQRQGTQLLEDGLEENAGQEGLMVGRKMQDEGIVEGVMRDRVSDRDHNKEIGIRSLEESVKIDVECQEGCGVVKEGKEQEKAMERSFPQSKTQQMPNKFQTESEQSENKIDSQLTTNPSQVQPVNQTKSQVDDTAEEILIKSNKEQLAHLDEKQDNLEILQNKQLEIPKNIGQQIVTNIQTQQIVTNIQTSSTVIIAQGEVRIQEQIEEQNTLEEKQYERVYNEELVEANGENVADQKLIEGQITHNECSDKQNKLAANTVQLNSHNTGQILIEEAVSDKQIGSQGQVEEFLESSHRLEIILEEEYDKTDSLHQCSERGKSDREIDMVGSGQLILQRPVFEQAVCQPLVVELPIVQVHIPQVNIPQIHIPQVHIPQVYVPELDIASLPAREQSPIQEEISDRFKGIILVKMFARVQNNDLRGWVADEPSRRKQYFDKWNQAIQQIRKQQQSRKKEEAEEDTKRQAELDKQERLKKQAQLARLEQQRQTQQQKQRQRKEQYERRQELQRLQQQRQNKQAKLQRGKEIELIHMEQDRQRREEGQRQERQRLEEEKRQREVEAGGDVQRQDASMGSDAFSNKIKMANSEVYTIRCPKIDGICQENAGYNQWCLPQEAIDRLKRLDCKLVQIGWRQEEMWRRINVVSSHVDAQ